MPRTVASGVLLFLCWDMLGMQNFSSIFLACHILQIAAMPSTFGECFCCLLVVCHTWRDMCDGFPRLWPGSSSFDASRCLAASAAALAAPGGLFRVEVGFDMCDGFPRLWPGSSSFDSSRCLAASAAALAAPGGLFRVEVGFDRT